MSISWCAKKLHLGVSLQIPSEKAFVLRLRVSRMKAPLLWAILTNRKKGAPKEKLQGMPCTESAMLQADLTAEAQLRFEALFYGFLRPRSLGSMWWYTIDSGLVRFRASELTDSGAGLACVFLGFRTPCPANDLARQCVRPGANMQENPTSMST